MQQKEKTGHGGSHRMGRSLLDPSKFSHSTTHPEQLVRRGWRRQAGVRSTWPPLLTACCRRSQMKSVFSLANAPVGCLSYGTAPSTMTLHTGSRVRFLSCQTWSVRKKEIKTHTLAETPSSLFIYGEEKHNRWMHRGFIVLACGPYGIVGFKVLSSDWVRVAQSPVS